MKQKAIHAVNKTKCIEKLSIMARITPMTLRKFAQGKRELNPEQIESIVAAGIRESFNPRKARK
jgi:hypothetical protein